MAVMSAADGAIIKGAEATRDARQELQSRISTVNSHVEAIGSGFQGESAVAFARLMNEWRTESTKVSSALEQFEDKLRKQQQTLDTGEQEQSSAFSKIASRMGGN